MAGIDRKTLSVAQSYADEQIKNVQAGGVSDSYLQDQINKNPVIANMEENINSQVNEYLVQNSTFVKVDDTIKCIGILAKYKRSLYNIPVIAVTGSVGKTSTKEMIANVLSTKYKVLKTEANYNNHIGLPLTIFGGISHFTINYIDVIVMLLSAILLFLFSFKNHRLDKKAGIVFLIIFVIYYSFVIVG